MPSNSNHNQLDTRRFEFVEDKHPITSSRRKVKPMSHATRLLKADPSQKRFAQELLLAFGLIGVIVLTRFLLVEWPNFKPVAAIALFSGFWFRNQCLPWVAIVVGMLVTDSVFGSYSWPIAIAVYLGLLTPLWFGKLLVRVPRRQLTKFAGCWLGSVFGGSIVFFFLTNLSVWKFSGMYTQTTTGLTECLVVAIPFFRSTLAGDFIFASLIFGGYFMAMAWMLRTDRQVLLN